MYLRFTVIVVLAIAVIAVLTTKSASVPSTLDASVFHQAHPKIALSAAGRRNDAPSLAPREDAPASSRVGTLTDGQALLKRAYAGDARAQFQLSERIRKCRSTLMLAERGVLSALPEAEACRRDGIPVEGAQAWRDKAIAAGDPIALLYEAFESKDEAKFAAAMDVAARSGDPEAHIALGHLFFRAEGADPIDGIAWLLVGCPDCMVDDPRLGIAPACIQFATCTPGMSFADWLASSQDEGEAALAAVQEAQARAKSLKALYGVP